MALTEWELNELNIWAYEVNEGNVLVGESLTLMSGLEVQVIETNAHEIGYEGLAVSPIIDGQVDEEQLIIISAGTSVGVVNVEIGPVNQIRPNNSTIGAIEGKFSKEGSSQIYVLNEWIEDLQARGYNVSQLSGHSQGAFSLKAGAKYGIPTTVFNGWFNYDTLTKEEKEYILSHPGLFINYRNRQDAVVFLNDGNIVYNDLGTIVWSKSNIFSKGFGHDKEGWKFDDDGNIILKESKSKKKNAVLRQLDNKTALALWNVESLRKKWSTNGSLTKNQEIYLDDSEALEIVKASKEMMDITMNTIILKYREGLADVEETWQKGERQSVDYAINLSYWEVLDALEDGGASRHGNVQNFLDELGQKEHEAAQMARDFEQLAREIESSINKLKETDKQLAQLLS